MARDGNLDAKNLISIFDFGIHIAIRIRNGLIEYAKTQNAFKNQTTEYKIEFKFYEKKIGENG
jgi:hypothetical protein